jgi:hypothetical protein
MNAHTSRGRGLIKSGIICLDSEKPRHNHNHGEAPPTQTYLFIGGNQDGLNIPLAPDVDVVQLPAGVTGKDNYLAATLTVDDVSITVYRHESLTPEKVLNRLVEHYKAWAVNRPGSRL